jgi:hypothetical protein
VTNWNETHRPDRSWIGWIVCQFKKHKLVAGEWKAISSKSRFRSAFYIEFPPSRLFVWVPLHCSRCGRVFEEEKAQ